MKRINILHNNKYYNKGKIRIIGGKWKGKKITVILHTDLRPTTDQIRETLFNWLTPIIKGANCLDCFAGSGALGLEALSRYAYTVTFLEKNKIICNALKKNIQLFNIRKQTKIITTDSITWLKSHAHHTKQYDIVFIDPPFSKFFYIKKTIKLLNELKYLSKNAWIYIETQNHNINLKPIVPDTWTLYKKKTQTLFLIKSILI